MDKNFSVERLIIKNEETSYFDIVCMSLYMNKTGDIIAKLVGNDFEVLEPYEGVREHLLELTKTLEESKSYSYNKLIKRYVLRDSNIKKLGI